jgi:diadenosine tetraphosphate (Ap4A) HIT family hydrolase
MSSLYVARDQTYRGTCVVIYDPAHATRPSELSDEAWRQFATDARTAERAASIVFKPDHVNLECLGNTVPHLHIAIIPRYRSDPRWGSPIWTTKRNEISTAPASDEQCAKIAGALREVINGAA